MAFETLNAGHYAPILHIQDPAARYYDTMAPQWDKCLRKPLLGQFRREETRIIGDLVSQIPHGPILDIGIGTGDLPVQLEDQGFSLPRPWIGIDLSPSMATIASTKGHHVAIGTARKLPFPTGHFQVCVAQHLLSLLKDEPLSEVLSEVQRVLRANSPFVFTAITHNEPSGEVIFARTYPQPKDPEQRRISDALDNRRSPLKYEELLKNVGFEVTACNRVAWDSVTMTAWKW